MTDHLEIERKFDVPSDFVVPDLSDVPGCARLDDPRAAQLIAGYFDTEDLRLAGHGITLRRRSGGDDDGWHLKLPIAAGVRREIHAPLGAGQQSVPAPLAGLVAAYTRGRELGPVATVETNRQLVRLLGAGGETLAEVADDRVLAEVTGRSDWVRWREVEVELGSGPADLLAVAGDRLVRAGARPAAAASKLARLLGDRRPLPRRRYRTAGDVVVGYVAEQVATLLTYDPRVRLAEPDAAHQMRVAVRKIRSVLRGYDRLLEPGAVARVDGELRWLAENLGAVRDLEVLHQRFAGRVDELGQRRPGWLDRLTTQQRTAQTRLVKAMGEQRYVDLLDTLDRFVAAPPLTGAAKGKAAATVRPLVARAWRRVDRSYAAVGRCDTDDDRAAALHRARKAAKRARYVAESARPVLGGPAKNVGNAARRMQTTLGAYQDGIVARQWLARMNNRGSDTFTLGMVAGVEHCTAPHTLDEVAATWATCAPPKKIGKLAR